MGDPVSNLLVEAWRSAPYNAKERSIDHAKIDYSLPAYVRAFLVMKDLPATESMTIEEAGYMPRVYGTHIDSGRRARLVLVSSMGDLGVAWRDVDQYSDRGFSVYDFENFGLSWDVKVQRTAAGAIKRVHQSKRAQRRQRGRMAA